MKFLSIFACAVIVFVMQLTLFQFFKISNTKLDVILIFVIYSGLKFGSTRGMITGFIFGFLEDFMSITLPGINGISKALTGFLSGKLEILYKDSKFAQVLIVFVFTLFDSFIVFVVTYLFQGSLNFRGFIINSLPIAVFLNSIFAPLIFKIGDGFIFYFRRSKING